MELFDHGLAIGADFIGHIIEIHGIKCVKVGFEAAGVMVFFRRFICFGFFPAFLPEGRHQG